MFSIEIVSDGPTFKASGSMIIILLILCIYNLGIAIPGTNILTLMTQQLNFIFKFLDI